MRTMRMCNSDVMCVNSALVYDQDCDFGDVAVVEPNARNTELLPSEKIDREKLSHLTNCWKEQHEEAFQTLKDVLIQATDNPLFVADFSKPFNVTVDASNHTVAGLLSQYDDEGQDRPIAFASQKLTPTQQAWSTVEKEAYAVIWALTKYRHWLFANEVVVFSDNNPLVFLTESVPKAPKLMRWALALQQFNCTFKYKVGKTNVVADCLSRPVGIRE